jgi:sugar transferase (PEP-CTERM/EpsH1 system associated)
VNARPARILYFSHSLGIGGLEVLLLELARRVDRKRFATAMCVMESGGGLEKEFLAAGIPVFHCSKKEGKDVFLPLRLARLMRREETAILHSNNYSPWIYGVLARKLVRGVRQVHTEHSNVDEGRSVALWAERQAARSTQALVADAGIVRAVLESRAGIPSRRVEVVYNGVDVDRYRPREEGSRDQLRITVGIVARLVPVKNHALLLRAFKEVRDGGPAGVRLLVVGDGPLREELEALARSLELGDSVRFLGFRRDIPEILRSLDVFVLCSNSEGHSLTLLEAMASGLPVVATDVGGNGEVVREGVNGSLVPPGDTGALAAALKELIAEPERARALGRAGRQDVERRFSLTAMTERYEKIYETVLDR